MTTITFKIDEEKLKKFDKTLPERTGRSEAIRRLIEREIKSEVGGGPTLSPAEKESIEYAIGLFNRGARQGGRVGFREGELFLHQYADIAESLRGLLTKLEEE